MKFRVIVSAQAVSIIGKDSIIEAESAVEAISKAMILAAESEIEDPKVIELEEVKS